LLTKKIGVSLWKLFTKTKKMNYKIEMGSVTKMVANYFPYYVMNGMRRCRDGNWPLNYKRELVVGLHCDDNVAGYIASYYDKAYTEKDYLGIKFQAGSIHLSPNPADDAVELEFTPGVVKSSDSLIEIENLCFSVLPPEDAPEQRHITIEAKTLGSTAEAMYSSETCWMSDEHAKEVGTLAGKIAIDVTKKANGYEFYLRKSKSRVTKLLKDVGIKVKWNIHH
jgi:hypothetical protein